MKLTLSLFFFISVCTCGFGQNTWEYISRGYQNTISNIETDINSPYYYVTRNFYDCHSNGTISCRNKTTDEVNWSYFSNDSYKTFILDIFNHEGKIYFLESDTEAIDVAGGDLYAGILNSEGRLIKKKFINSIRNERASIYSNSDSSIYVIADDKVYALDEDLSTYWTYDLEHSALDLAVSENGMLAIVDKGYLYHFSENNELLHKLSSDAHFIIYANDQFTTASNTQIKKYHSDDPSIDEVVFQISISNLKSFIFDGKNYFEFWDKKISQYSQKLEHIKTISFPNDKVNKIASDQTSLFLGSNFQYMTGVNSKINILEDLHPRPDLAAVNLVHDSTIATATYNQNLDKFFHKYDTYSSLTVSNVGGNNS